MELREMLKELGVEDIAEKFDVENLVDSSEWEAQIKLKLTDMQACGEEWEKDFGQILSKEGQSTILFYATVIGIKAVRDLCVVGCAVKLKENGGDTSMLDREAIVKAAYNTWRVKSEEEFTDRTLKEMGIEM